MDIMTSALILLLQSAKERLRLGDHAVVSEDRGHYGPSREAVSVCDQSAWCPRRRL